MDFKSVRVLFALTDLKSYSSFGVKMNQMLDEFLANYPVELRDLVMAVRALILEVMPEAIEQLDPSANLIGYGTDRTYKGLVCGIIIYKTYVNLMFARGRELARPGGPAARNGQTRAAHQD